ncbi:MAG TPA: CPBP family intramembrane glutamic endopeptidase [Gemmatimonadaceae bacterium]|jgi:membrane protease YdiL (CAAX protease family)|nr:CPBP family intramembrane glutamic endopeptidase [Gemmatimonadaceae bacterium]
MPTADALYLTVIAIGLCLDAFVLWPAFLRRSEADPARARVWLWSSIIILWWTLVAAGVVLWMFQRRDWAELRLVAPHGWRVLGTIGLLTLIVIFYASRIGKIARARRSKKRIKFPEDVERRAPHTRVELAWFVALSVTAGICEEFIFRGYLIWVLQPVFGLWGAAAVSVVAFAAGHAYEGTKGALATGVVGVLLTLVVLGFGSLVPAIAAHALIDASEGLIAWLALREVETAHEGESGHAGELIV